MTRHLAPPFDADPHPDRAPTPAAEQVALRIRCRLDAAASELPHDVSERLRAARTRALAQRKRAPAAVRVVHTAPAVLAQGATARATPPGHGLGWWRLLGSALPALALVVGLAFISQQQQSRHLVEVATLDEALLTDAVPPQAYADPGFVAFLGSAASDHSLHLLSDDALMRPQADGAPWHQPDKAGTYPDAYPDAYSETLTQ